MSASIERRLSVLTWHLIAVVAMETITGVWLLLRIAAKVGAL